MPGGTSSWATTDAPTTAPTPTPTTSRSSCFISYNTHDEAIARRLAADLQAHGVRCWFAPHDLQIGDSILDQIDQAIRTHQRLLLILSSASLASRRVETEVTIALARERREGGQVLFPIRIDAAIEQAQHGRAALLPQQRHIGDFQHWKMYDAYQEAFARLLRDLHGDPPA